MDLRASNKARRTLGGLLLAIFTALAFGAPAAAHVTVNPNEAAQGGYTTLTFKVPNEKDNASTTKLEVTFPDGHGLRSVSLKPVAGWTYAVEKTKLATPVQDEEGGEITEAVSKITWSGGEIKPGEYQDFPVSVGPLPEDKEFLTFKSLQTYSNGEVVRWIDESTEDGAELEHPAPVLSLNSESSGDAAADSEDDDDDEERTLVIISLILSAVALIIALVSFRKKTQA